VSVGLAPCLSPYSEPLRLRSALTAQAASAPPPQCPRRDLSAVARGGALEPREYLAGANGLGPGDRGGARSRCCRCAPIRLASCRPPITWATVTWRWSWQGGRSCDCFRTRLLEELAAQRGLVVERITAPFQPERRLCQRNQPFLPIPSTEPGARPPAKLLQLVSPALAGGGVQSIFRGPGGAGASQRITSAWRSAQLVGSRARRGAIAIEAAALAVAGGLRSMRDGELRDRLSARAPKAAAHRSRCWLLPCAKRRGAAGPAAPDGTGRCLALVR